MFCCYAAGVLMTVSSPSAIHQAPTIHFTNGTGTNITKCVHLGKFGAILCLAWIKRKELYGKFSWKSGYRIPFLFFFLGCCCEPSPHLPGSFDTSVSIYLGRHRCRMRTFPVSAWPWCCCLWCNFFFLWCTVLNFLENNDDVL